MDHYTGELKEYIMVATNEKNPKKSILAPLYVVKEEKAYWIWVVFVAFFGLINIWSAFLLGEIDSVKSAMDEGIIYTYSTSVCAPFLAEVLVKFYRYTIWRIRAKEISGNIY